MAPTADGLYVRVKQRLLLQQRMAQLLYQFSVGGQQCLRFKEVPFQFGTENDLLFRPGRRAALPARHIIICVC